MNHTISALNEIGLDIIYLVSSKNWPPRSSSFEEHEQKKQQKIQYKSNGLDLSEHESASCSCWTASSTDLFDIVDNMQTRHTLRPFWWTF